MQEDFKQFNPYLWLEDRIKFGLKVGLENISQVMSQLGGPHQSYKTLLVAGTNGKGYTTSLSAKLLTDSGLKVGWFISPHLINVRERIRIGKQVIRSDQFKKMTWELALQLQPQQQISYFEAITIIASLYFKQQGVDIAIFEVGLGGRYDSTNIHNADYSIITSIGLDHVEFLGDNLSSILKEKSGVFRPNQKSWVQLTQDQLREEVVELSKSAGTELDLQEVRFLEDPQGHFKRNQSLAIAASKQILTDNGLKVNEKNWELICQNHQWDGRQQKVNDPIWMKKFPNCLIDGAHNPESFKELLLFSEKQLDPGVLVVGLMGDKALKEIFDQLVQFETLGWQVLFVKGSFPRFADPKKLVKAYPGESTEISFEALIQGKFECLGDFSKSSLLICGSLYLMGEVIGSIAERCPQFEWYRQFSASSNEMIRVN